MPDDNRTDRILTAALRACLADAGHITASARLAPLSGGRTNRLWLADTDDGKRVVKLYAEPTANPLFANDPGAEHRLLRHLSGSGLAPRPESFFNTRLGQVLVYGYVAGATWQSDPEPVADALARLHRRTPPPGLPSAPDGSAALTMQTEAILALCPAREAAPLHRLAPAGEVRPSAIAALLHGDVVPGNIVAGPAHVTLIDWQCPAKGDPVHDLATFLSPAMQLTYRGAALNEAETARFLDAYGNHGTVTRYLSLAPWFHWRMAAYCLWRVSRGADDYRPALALECDRLGPDAAAAVAPPEV